MDNTMQAQPEAQPGTQPADANSKEMFKKLILASFQIVYEPEIAKGLVAMMKQQADDPAQGVAHAAMAVLGKMKEAVKGIPPDAVYTAAPAIIIFLFDIAKAAGIFQADKNTLTQALQDLAQMTKQPDQSQQAEIAPQTAQQAPGGIIGMQPGMGG